MKIPRRIELRLEETLLARFDYVCKRENANRSDKIREIMNEHVNQFWMRHSI